MTFNFNISHILFSKINKHIRLFFVKIDNLKLAYKAIRSLILIR